MMAKLQNKQNNIDQLLIHVEPKTHKCDTIRQRWLTDERYRATQEARGWTEETEAPGRSRLHRSLTQTYKEREKKVEAELGCKTENQRRKSWSQ